jgi:hypothetical protein
MSVYIGAAVWRRVSMSPLNTTVCRALSTLDTCVPASSRHSRGTRENALKSVLVYHPHLHILISDGCFHENEMFSVSPSVDTKTIERLFRHKVLRMLLNKGKITPDMITLMDKWRHTGFNVFAGPRILLRYEKSMENLAR